MKVVVTIIAALFILLIIEQNQSTFLIYYKCKKVDIHYLNNKFSNKIVSIKSKGKSTIAFPLAIKFARISGKINHSNIVSVSDIIKKYSLFM